MKERTTAEWITFGVAMMVLMSLIVLVLYDWGISQNRPPILQVEAGEVRVEQDQFYVPFVVTNVGGEIAEAIQVLAELKIPGEAIEHGEQQIESLSAGARKQGNFVFSHDPQQGELVVRVASFSLPQSREAVPEARSEDLLAQPS